jgi:hypothetical protein
MKTSQRHLKLVLPIVLIAFFSRETLAQSLSQGPAELGQGSSVLEIMNWLDKTMLPNARVGVRTSSTPQIESDSHVLKQDERPSDSLFYSQGFKLVNVDRCNLTLRNDDAKLIAHSSLVAGNMEQYKAELFVPLARLSDKKGRRPYRHTSNPEKSRLLGTWRTEFKSKRSREEALLTLYLPGHTEKIGGWAAETLTFTFDSREMSEQFDAAFRHAVRLCRTK